VWATDRGTKVIKGDQVTDAEALGMLGLSAVRWRLWLLRRLGGEWAVEIPGEFSLDGLGRAE
jgi:hypothetical protein